MVSIIGLLNRPSRGSDAGGGSNSGHGAAVESTPRIDRPGSFHHAFGGGFGNIGQVLEQPRNRPVPEQLHHAA